MLDKRSISEFAPERLIRALEQFGVDEPPPYTASQVHRYFNTEAAHAAESS